MKDSIDAFNYYRTGFQSDRQCLLALWGAFQNCATGEWKSYQDNDPEENKYYLVEVDTFYSSDQKLRVKFFGKPSDARDESWCNVKRFAEINSN